MRLNNNISFVSDAAVERSDSDHFNRKSFAFKIAETMIQLSDPASLVVGIYGVWGEGKTSVLNFIIEKFAASDTVIPVRFNPWRFTTEDALIESFFITLAEGLDGSLKSVLEEKGEKLEKYGGILSLAKVVGLDIGTGVKEIGKALSTVSIDELRNRLSTLLKQNAKRVVVLMDDIDRLNKQEIQTVFRLIKLSADFNYTSYILFFDEEMVASALSEQYGVGDPAAGKAFLEKIVQVPLYLPRIEQAALWAFWEAGVRQTLKDVQVEMDEVEWYSFQEAFKRGIGKNLKTPRMCKRYANAIGFALSLLKGEVNHEHLLLLEGLRIFSPLLYNMLRAHIEVYISAGALPREFDTCSEGELQLLNELLGNQQGMFQTLRQQRYTHRYFSYSLPPDVIPDTEIDHFLDQLSYANCDEGVEFLSSLCREKGKTEVIYSLNLALERRPVGLPIVVCLARSGENFTDSDRDSRELVHLIVMQVSRVAWRSNHSEYNVERYLAVKNIIESGKPVNFVHDLVNRLVIDPQDALSQAWAQWQNEVEARFTQQHNAIGSEVNQHFDENDFWEGRLEVVFAQKVRGMVEDQTFDFVPAMLFGGILETAFRYDPEGLEKCTVERIKRNAFDAIQLSSWLALGVESAFIDTIYDFIRKAYTPTVEQLEELVRPLDDRAKIHKMVSSIASLEENLDPQSLDMIADYYFVKFQQKKNDRSTPEETNDGDQGCY